MIYIRSGYLLFFIALQIDCFKFPIPSFWSTNFKSCSRQNRGGFKAKEMSSDAAKISLERKNLDHFILWAKTTGITFNKIALNQLESGQRGCFATEDISPGEVFLRVSCTDLPLRQKICVLISDVMQIVGT